jgi:hypothetical protein
MAKSYFVKIFAPDKRFLHSLRDFELDLFQPTVRSNEQEGFSIEGLLTLQEISKLVEFGYQIHITEESGKRARAQHEVTSFQEWLKNMEEK